MYRNEQAPSLIVRRIFIKSFSAIEKLVDATREDKLLVAAFIVATLRQMGVNGHFIGYDPASQWAWFQPVEVLSGIAMALLEGLALAYVSRRWRNLEPKTREDWIYWSLILLGMLTMLVSIIFYVALYAYAAQREATVAQVFLPWVNMVWNITVAGANPLIALLIGVVGNNEDVPSEDEVVVSYEEEAWLSLVNYLQRTNNVKILPNELANIANVPISAAADVIKKASDLGMLQ